jgi:hypothetical protein
MAEVKGHDPGTLCWADLSSPDLRASSRFYAGVFGWRTLGSAAPEPAGYTVFTLRGKPVAGLAQLEGGAPAWSSYIAVVDADSIAARAERRGGTVLRAPFDVLNLGRMAILADPGGAPFGVLQPSAHRGAELVNEPGSLCWSELLTRDARRCKPFYEALFGWKGKVGAADATYTEWTLAARSVGGMLEMGNAFPDDVRPHWAVYFAVSDCADTAARASGLGATVLRATTSIAPGYFATLLDPTGAAFNLLEFREAA